MMAVRSTRTTRMPVGITAMSPRSASIPDSGSSGLPRSISSALTDQALSSPPTFCLSRPTDGVFPVYSPAPPAPPAQSLRVARQLTGPARTFDLGDDAGGVRQSWVCSYRAARKRVGSAK